MFTEYCSTRSVKCFVGKLAQIITTQFDFLFYAPFISNAFLKLNLSIFLWFLHFPLIQLSKMRRSWRDLASLLIEIECCCSFALINSINTGKSGVRWYSVLFRKTGRIRFQYIKCANSLCAVFHRYRNYVRGGWCLCVHGVFVWLDGQVMNTWHSISKARLIYSLFECFDVHPTKPEFASSIYQRLNDSLSGICAVENKLILCWILNWKSATLIWWWLFQ